MQETTFNTEQVEEILDVTGAVEVETRDPLAAVTREVRASAFHNPEQYLNDSLVPEGGE